MAGLGRVTTASTDTIASGDDCGNGGSGTSGAARPVDPNELTGPSGYGPDHYILNSVLLPYRINFENDPEATAPAQDVRITNPLAAGFDWSSFELTEIAFGDRFIAVPAGSQHFATTVAMSYNGVSFEVHIEAGIHPATGEVYAHFWSLDPGTGLPPAVEIGFLPPEDGTGRGQGHISYTIRAKAGLGTGTVIRNVAEITFDGQPPIATNLIDPHDPSQGTDPDREAPITLDADPPTSSVDALPAVTTTPNVAVSWFGSDGPGSGVASFDVFVAVDGGPFQLWLSRTTATAATYTARDGQRLGFYSVARDQVGNRETAPDAAQAITRVVVPAYTLIVTKSGTGAGTVTSSPAGIDCGNDCSEVFASGTKVTLTAEAADGSEFSEWGGACSGAGSCVVDMTASKGVVATFIDNTFCWPCLPSRGGWRAILGR